MSDTKDRPPLRVVAARIALAVGSLAGLGWLAPLEYGTGIWLGMGAFAICVPLLIDSYVVLSVLTARDRAYSLPIAAVSGFVGQLHAAGVIPESSTTDQGTVAAVAVLIAVAVTARLKPLVEEVVEEYRRAVEEVRLRAVREVADAARERHDMEQAELDAAHRRAVELALAVSGAAVQEEARRAVASAQEAAQLAVAEAEAHAEAARRRADELDRELTGERAARAVELAELRAESKARSAHREPSGDGSPGSSRRPARSAHAQVRPEVAAELTTAEVAVLSWMLGRGEQRLQAIVDGSRVPLSTVKRALAGLTAKGHVMSGDSRGMYRSVDPDVGSGEPAEQSDEPSRATS